MSGMRGTRRKILAAVVAVGVLAGGATAAVMAVGGGTALAAAGPGARVAAAATAPRTCAPLAALVEKGTITQAQADAVRAAMVRYMQDHGRSGWTGDTPPALQANGPLATVLAQLVKDGTITQSQATAITNAFADQLQARSQHGPGYGPGMGSGSGPGMMGGVGGGPPWADSSAS